jgi:hypothetical protein
MTEPEIDFIVAGGTQICSLLISPAETASK